MALHRPRRAVSCRRLLLGHAGSHPAHRPAVIFDAGSAIAAVTSGTRPTAITAAMAEAIEVLFDPQKAELSARLLELFFFQIHDSDDQESPGQRCRHELSARGILHYERRAEAGSPRTPIADGRGGRACGPARSRRSWRRPAIFWQAEPEHQDYLERYPNGYTCHFVPAETGTLCRSEAEVAPPPVEVTAMAKAKRGVAIYGIKNCEHP